MAALDELIGSWALSLRAANRSPRTVAQCVHESLAQFRRWMAEHEPGVGPGEITRQHVEAYLADIASTRSAPTAPTRYKALRLFFAWAAEEGEVEQNPMANVRPLIVPEQPVPVLADDELRALLASCSARKGPLTSSGLGQMLERRGEAAGLGRIHPHQLRHTFAHALAGRWRRRGRPHAPGWLAVAPDAGARRGVDRRTSEPGRPTGASRPAIGSSCSWPPSCAALWPCGAPCAGNRAPMSMPGACCGRYSRRAR